MGRQETERLPGAELASQHYQVYYLELPAETLPSSDNNISHTNYQDHSGIFSNCGSEDW